MIKTEFPIAVKGEDGQPTSLIVEGYRPTADSFLAVHRPDGDTLNTVTFLPCGSAVNSIFPDQLRKVSCRKLLLEFIAKLEAAEPASWLVLSCVPWGQIAPAPDWALEAISLIRTRARQL